MSRVARSDKQELLAALNCKGPHGESMPWINLIKDDINVLLEDDKAGSNLSEVYGLKAEERYIEIWNLAKNFPHEWAKIVDLYFSTDDDAVPSSEANTRSQVNAPLVCSVCNKIFADARKRAVHQWSEHGIKSSVRAHIGSISQSSSSTKE